jgi:hypothetical protein
MLSDGSFVPPHGWVYAPDLQADADRYRFLRQTEEALSTEAEEILAVAWSKITKKGCWLGEMDAVVDEARRLTANLEDDE